MWFLKSSKARASVSDVLYDLYLYLLYRKINLGKCSRLVIGNQLHHSFSTWLGCYSSLCTFSPKLNNSPDLKYAQYYKLESSNI